MKRTAAVVLFLFCFASICSSQSQSIIDSLINLSNQATDDQTKVGLLNAISYKYLDVDINHSSTFSQEAYELAKSIDYTYGAVEALSNNSFIHMQMGKIPESIELADLALKMAQKNNADTTLTMAYGALGNAYAEYGKNDEALAFYQKALDINTNRKDYLNQSYTLHNIAYLKETIGDLKGAEKYYRKALNVAIESKDEKLIGDAYNSIGHSYLNSTEYDSAAYYFKNGLDISKKYNDKWFEGMNLSGLALSESGRGNYEFANSLLHESIALFSKTNNDLGISNSFFSLAENSVKKGDHPAAIIYYKKSLNHLKDTSNLMTHFKLHKKISISYAAIGEMDKAYEHLQTYEKINKSILSSERKKQLLELEAKYQNEKKEAENKMLLAEQAKDKATIKLQLLISISAILGTLLLGFLLITVQKNYKQKKNLNIKLEKKVAERTASLAEKNQQLKNIIKELERFNHIASHDIKEPIRIMGSMAGLIRRKLPEDIRNEMEEDLNIIIDGSRQLYTLMEDIKAMSKYKKESVKINEFNVNNMAQTVVKLLTERISSSNAVVEIQKLPVIKSSESLLTIIFKNLIENGIKYNESIIPRVLVKYQESNNHHTFIFKDNGMGIKEEYREKIFDMFIRLNNRTISGSGIGLYNVKIATEKLNGKITINGKEGEGSEFIFSIPKTTDRYFFQNENTLKKEKTT